MESINECLEGAKMIELTLPYPPSVNSYKSVGRLRTTKTGKLYQPKYNSVETNRFYYEVWMLIQQKKAKEGLKSFDSSTISVEMDVWVPDARKRDIDNVVKPTLDSLQRAGMFDDDYQIALLTIKRCPIISNGQIIVRIKPI